MEYLALVGLGLLVGWFLGFRNTQERESRIQASERALRQREVAVDEDNRRKGEALARQESAVLENAEKMRASTQEYADAREAEFRGLASQTAVVFDEFKHGFIRGRRWLAKAFAEFIEMRDREVECWLVVKPTPALKASELVAELREKRRSAHELQKFVEYQLASYEEYFPALKEYRDAILDESVDLRKAPLEALQEADAALAYGYLTKEEYERLSQCEKFQLALDRYWARNKSKVEIGRVYERYMGYLYERDAWRVEYQGALRGFEDFGRDLICSKGDEAHIVQCKCWSQEKLIREKYLFQLFGTAVLYRLEHPGLQVMPVFATTTELSSAALMVAGELDVVVRKEALVRYPMIKCNINPSTGEKIYHLPFDQQYDRVLVGNIEGEFYAETVKEAAAAGFRRAYRWSGNREGEEQ